ncbi:uncharacterized protein BO97DRAFT_451536 [Aspergillus homomorphus CBS 101889]|uniref:F-box domain-containing protein n=1 Tax=Aspergillus homomorphus (strain CBS 101889) TaxID=1450537 RepID=A0A395HX33_ASPHC|nr:hypothetical protein BO97DRAFT_451536 [Aspergillus homomorphus CBS 101889]RAL12357.1 hypothetical protein BO97DRAFT_451536 [Aspergillus homomorphus CBS 101889]
MSTPWSGDLSGMAERELNNLAVWSEMLDMDAIGPSLLQHISESLTEPARQMLQPVFTPQGESVSSPRLHDFAAAMRCLRTDMTAWSIAKLEILASSFDPIFSQFPRRLRIEGSRAGPNTPFYRRTPGQSIWNSMGLPEIRKLRDLIRYAFTNVNEFEFVLGPEGAQFNDMVNPGDVPRIIFDILNSVQRPVRALYFVMEDSSWYVQHNDDFYAPMLSQRVLESLETVVIQWPYFPVDFEHPMFGLFQNLFHSPLQHLTLEGKGLDYLFPSVQAALFALPSAGCGLRSLTLKGLYVSDHDMCALIPKVPVLASLTLEDVHFNGRWPDFLHTLSNMCPYLSEYNFTDVLCCGVFEWPRPPLMSSSYRGLPPDTHMDLLALAELHSRHHLRGAWGV